MIDQQTLKSLMKFTPETGNWERLVRTGRCVRIGGFTPYVRQDGYAAIRVKSYQYLAHRLAWLYVHGEWPTGDIDHVNGDKADNRIANLRDVPHKTNCQNRRKANKNNKTGLLGASKHGGKYTAAILLNGKQVYIGDFNTPEDAHVAHLSSKRINHEGCTI